MTSVQYYILYVPKDKIVQLFFSQCTTVQEGETAKKIP